MSPEEEAARLEAWRPVIDWMQAQAEHTIVEHADVFALLQKAKAGDPAAEKVLKACIGEIEGASPAEKADILRVIRVAGRPGRPPGSSTVKERRQPIIDEARRRISQDEPQASVINDLAPRLPGASSLSSAKSYMRGALRDAD